MKTWQAVAVVCVSAVFAPKALAAEDDPEVLFEDVSCIDPDTVHGALWLWPEEVQELFEVRFTDAGVIEERTTFALVNSALMGSAAGFYVSWFNQIWFSDLLIDDSEYDPLVTVHHEIAHR